MTEIFISGDFCPNHRGMEKNRCPSKVQNIFGKLYDKIQKSDLSITNLEGPLTNEEQPIEKIGPNLKIPPTWGPKLKKAGFDLVTLANNHILDQGEAGLKDTIKNLKKNEIDWVGAGESLAQAKKPYYFSENGFTIAIVNFAEVEYSCANQNHGGANPMDIIENFNQVKEAKRNSDYIIVITHGGHEHFHYPSPEMIKRYRFIAENGADVVINHHTHCVGGFEVHEGVPIFYSLGNFLFPSSKKKEYEKQWFEGYNVLLKIKNKNINFEILPHTQCEDDIISVNLKSKDSKLYKKIIKLSEDLKNEDLLASNWDEYIKEKKHLLKNMEGLNKDLLFALEKLKIKKHLIDKNKTHRIKQFVTCQAHQEVSKELLREYLKY